MTASADSNNSEKPDSQAVNSFAARRSLGAVRLAWTLAWLGAVAVVFTLVPLYIGNEAPYYWSDFNYYEWATRQSLISMLNSPITYPLLLLFSANLTHNLFFTAPLVFLMLALGDTRVGFVESVSLVYFLPFVMLLARMGAELFKSLPGKRWPFILTITCLLIPPLWAPLLRGYPDYCAALALIWCVHLYFQNRALTSLRSKLKIGFFLALAVLLRRYFAYEGIAFVIAMVADQYLLKKAEAKVSGRPLTVRLKDSLISLLEIGATGATTVIALGFPFLLNVTRHNYHALYESYHVSLPDSLGYFYQAYGPVLIIASLAGYALALKLDILNRANLRFVTMFYGLGAVFWLLGPNELGTHYTLYFTPLIATGLMSLVVSLARSNKMALAATIPLYAYLFFNLYICLLPAKQLAKLGIEPAIPAMLSNGGSPANEPGQFFSANYGPWQRTDRMALHNIVTDMRATIQANQDSNLAATMAQFSQTERRGLVYVAATSNLLTGEVLRNAERELYGKFGDIIAWAELPCVDSKDSYALERLLGASYVVLPSKAQFFIAPKEEDILTAILQCFKEKWPLANDFKKCEGVPVQTLDDGVAVTVYERVQPTSIKSAALTLGLMRKYIKERPGSQPQWISTGTLSEICYDLKRKDFQFRLNAPRERSLEGEQRYLLYSDELPESFVLEGTVVKKDVAADLAVDCIQLDAEGNQIVSQQIALKDPRTRIKLELERGRTAYLALVLDRAANVEDGTIIFENMQLRKP